MNIFDLLIEHNGFLTTSEITISLNNSPPTARRIMAELNAVELVDLNDIETKTEEKQIILKHEFDWFLTDEFKELREGFEPTDNSEFVKEYCKKYNTSLKEKIPPWYTYTCYQCKKVNHGTPVYQTNSLNDYQRHWISSGHKGPCQPNLIDCEHHGWEPQGKEWETS